MKNKGSIVLIITVSLFLFVGIIFATAGMHFYKADSDFKKNAKSTEATIEDIDISYSYDSDGERKKDYNVYVGFIVEGKKYEGYLNSYNSSMRVGSKIKVYYDTLNPANFKSSSDSIAAIVFIIVGLVIMIIGIVIMLVNVVISVKTKNRKAYLMQNGIRISATIDNIDYNYNYSVNGMHPYKIKCSYKDIYTNKIYIFNSKNIWFDVQSIVTSGLTSVVDVYMDKNDPTKYYIDLDSLKKYIAN